jgi:F-type H+-transporting ATPase subunit delta
MSNQSTIFIAKVYSRAIRAIATENGSNESFMQELEQFVALLNKSSDLETVLFHPLFSMEEKKPVLLEVCQKSQYSKLFVEFLVFLLDEKRLGLVPQIYKELIVIEDEEKGFLKGTIEGNEDQIDQAKLLKVVSWLKSKLSISPILNYEKNEKVTSGYKVTVGDYQLDVSLDHQLDDFVKTILV